MNFGLTASGFLFVLWVNGTFDFTPKNNLIGVKTSSADSYQPACNYDLPCRAT